MASGSSGGPEQPLPVIRNAPNPNLQVPPSRKESIRPRPPTPRAAICDGSRPG